MIKFFIRNFRGTCSFVEMLKGYMLICRNAEGVRSRRKFGNPCPNPIAKLSHQTPKKMADVNNKWQNYAKHVA